MAVEVNHTGREWKARKASLYIRVSECKDSPLRFVRKRSKIGLSCKASKCSDAGTGALGVLITHNSNYASGYGVPGKRRACSSRLKSSVKSAS